MERTNRVFISASTLPKKDGNYMCRMLSKKRNHHYNFITYAKGRGFLCSMEVTHYIELKNPEPLDQEDGDDIWNFR